jgi:hypothetical protein
MAMLVVTVGTRPKPPRRGIEKVREVGALRERATSSRFVLAAGMRARPYTLPWTVCYMPCKPLVGPTAPTTKPTHFVAALGDLRTLARVSRAHSRNSVARVYGPSRPYTGYGVTCARKPRITTGA